MGQNRKNSCKRNQQVRPSLSQGCRHQTGIWFLPLLLCETGIWIPQGKETTVLKRRESWGEAGDEGCCEQWEGHQGCPLCFTATWCLRSYADKCPCKGKLCSGGKRRCDNAWASSFQQNYQTRAGWFTVNLNPKNVRTSAKRRVDRSPSSGGRRDMSHEGLPHQPVLQVERLFSSQCASWHQANLLLIAVLSWANPPPGVQVKQTKYLPWLTPPSMGR